ncbi:Cbb3-type cytochrome c oxidase subunit CcoP2 [Alcanivorax sp. ALC70]|nr:Cbb3-type cytochrome c oxidase subunit CcoP2 [Alcanivorax sp. ALC70]
MSQFWSIYIIAIVVLNLVGCAILLLVNLKMTPEEARNETTGHSFDGIQERNQPLPRWWLFLFVGP